MMLSSLLHDLQTVNSSCSQYYRSMPIDCIYMIFSQICIYDDRTEVFHIQIIFRNMTILVIKFICDAPRCKAYEIIDCLRVCLFLCRFFQHTVLIQRASRSLSCDADHFAELRYGGTKHSYDHRYTKRQIRSDIGNQ